MIPTLITMDLEVAHDYDIDEQRNILKKLCEDLKGLPISIFTTSESVDYFPDQIRMLRLNKNEICCHGFNHSREENYKFMPENKISENIQLATANIENNIQEKPVCFRGPSMTTSTKTQNILIQNGYISDFSICSQRMDFINSDGGDIKWLLSPRFPYHPSDKSPYKRGNLPIWVVPLSCIGIPFISGILYLFGLRFMKFFLQLLIKEALKTMKPIVYLFHSYEYCRYTGSESSIIDIKDSRINKRKLIHTFYEQDPIKRYNINISLLKYILSLDLIRPFTGKEYSEFLNRTLG